MSISQSKKTKWGLEFRQAGQEYGFPPINNAREDGLLTIGGNLSPDRLLVAYANGIFPWPLDEEQPVFWFSPNPRTVLIPNKIRMNRSLRRAMNKAPYKIRLDSAFSKVVTACKTVERHGNNGTWITLSLVEVYKQLHKLGFAHSAEAWDKDRLVGGVFGVSIGSAFFGESMFRYESDASKVALLALLKQLAKWQFLFLDCQFSTAHLEQMGAKKWSQSFFQKQLALALEGDMRRGKWEVEKE